MTAEGANHAFDFGLHVALRRGARRCAAIPVGVRRDRLAAAARLETAHQACPILNIKNILFCKVAMEVQRVQVEGLRGANFFLGKFGNWKQSVKRPESPRDRGIDANAPAVQAKHRIFAEPLHRKPAEAEIDCARLRVWAWLMRVPTCFQLVKHRSVQIPEFR